MHSILAARSDFSIGQSILTADRLIDAAIEAGEKVVALTDTMSITGMINFSSEAKKKGIKPIIGTRLRLTDNPTWRPGVGEKKKHMPREYFLTVYALTAEGMRGIFRLLTLANSDKRFYYVPKLGFEDLYAEMDLTGAKDLAVVMGDGPSVMEHPDYVAIIAKLKSQVTMLFAPLVPIDTPYFGRINDLSINAMIDHGIEPLVVRPALYDKGHADTQEIMTAITENQKVTDPWFRSRFNRDMHVMSIPELIEELKKSIGQSEKRGVTGAAHYFKLGMKNTNHLVNACKYEWEKSEPSLPVMAPDEFKAVVDECKLGWKSRFEKPVFGHTPTQKDLQTVYVSRLKYELGILEKLNFSGYFLLVQDIVRFAKSSDILVGPGRGSVGGSLVAYLMGITECDPIRFGLMFERFINPDRLDLPDADLDFMSERRHEVVEYLVKKYGTDRVAGVSNFGTLAAASAMRDVGRVTGVPERDYSVSKMVPKLHGANVSLPDCRSQVPEINAFANAYPTLWPVMERLEGTIRNMSQHAAGIVVGGVDLVERAVVERRKESSIVCFDKTAVEDQGLVKVDILGLRTLDVIDLTMKYVRERTGKRLEISRIPLDDEEVLLNFARGNTTGIFQFESGGMRRLLRELGSGGTVTFDDITAATALYRPGPMESGMMNSFYLRKQGNEPIQYDHPKMMPILEETFGVIVYQEQVMKISQVISGYSGADADKLRKIMGKKQPEEMKKGRQKFVDGAQLTSGMTEFAAEQLFDMIAGFAGYGFNKSHSVEYTLISYQAMWLKINYGVEFYAAALTLLDADKLPALVKDAKSYGIEIATPDINNSTGRFEILTDAKLVIPFTRIKGISNKATAEIIKARETGPFTSMGDFRVRVEKRTCNVRVQSALDLVGAFSGVEPTQPLPTDPIRIKDLIDLIPALISSDVPIDREMESDRAARTAVEEIIDDYRKRYGPGSKEPSDGLPVKPSFGKSARFMMIADAPGGEEDISGTMGISMSSATVTSSMEMNDLDRSDVYWTALIKRPKRDKQVTPDEVERYIEYLDREIEALKPTVIVLLGSITARTFFPALRGKASEMAGKVIYDKERDANFVIGFNPGEIYHDPDKQSNMDDVFSSVSRLLN